MYFSLGMRRLSKGTHVHPQACRFRAFCPNAMHRCALRPAEDAVNATRFVQHLPLDVVVTPRSGPPVADLQQQDFTVLDNKTPRHIKSFHAFGGSQAPVQCLYRPRRGEPILTRALPIREDEIDRFLRANGGQLAYPTEIGFLSDNGVQIQQAFSTNGNELSSSLDQYNVCSPPHPPLLTISVLSDRFNLSMTGLSSLVASEAKLPGRKLILWVSPGWPILSGPRVSPRRKARAISSSP